MDAAQPTEQDLLKTVWIFPEFLQAVGPLNESNVMEYFSHSPFFDRQSTNQQLKMQTIHAGNDGLNEAEELRRFTGVEFALVHARAPALFIVHKRERLSPDLTRTLASYSIINSNIYLSPSLENVLSSRLTTAVDALHASMATLRDRLGKEAPFNPRGETQVVFAQQAAAPKLSSSDVKPDEAASLPSAASAGAAGAVNVMPSLVALQSALAMLPALNRQASTAPHPPAADLSADKLGLGLPPSGASARGGGSTAGTPTPGGPGTGRSGMVPTPPPTSKSTGTPVAGQGQGGGRSKKKKRKLESTSVDLGAGGKQDDSSPFTTTPVV